VGVKPPEFPKQGYWLDFGEDFQLKGIVTTEPPKVEGRFAVLLPQVDADGIDLVGVRMPAVAAPLGTFTGWNLRAAATGAPRQMTSGLGAFFAFPEAEIVKRYGNKEGYLKKIDAATSALVQQRFLLEADRGRVAAHASALWDYVEKQSGR